MSATLFAPYIIDLLSELLQQAGNVDGKVYVPYELLARKLAALQPTLVRWDTEDFKTVAAWKKGVDWRHYYDPSMFEKALHQMIKEHDAETGITWKTVGLYLERYCRAVQLAQELDAC